MHPRNTALTDYGYRPCQKKIEEFRGGAEPSTLHAESEGVFPRDAPPLGRGDIVLYDVNKIGPVLFRNL